MATLRTIPILEFIRRIKPNSTDDGKYALFLGAGCSVTSGIPAAATLVKNKWLPRLHELQAPENKDVELWAKNTITGYDPANPAASYGKVFDLLFLSRRRCVEGSSGIADGVFLEEADDALGIPLQGAQVC